MIIADQPTIFGDAIKAHVSSQQDGSMRLIDSQHVDIRNNIYGFLKQAAIQPELANYLGIRYDKTKFTQYTRVELPKEPLKRTEFDGFATNVPGTALFLPLADCTGAIFFDPTHHAVMVSHLGRHSTEQKGALESVRYMQWEFRSKPSELLIWLGPSPNGGVYPLWARDNMSLIEANRLDLIEAGIVPGHIEASPVDTARDENYYSHSEFLKGHRDADGRFAIVAQLL